MSRKIALIDGRRTPFMKSFTTYADQSLYDLLSPCMDSLISDYNLEGEELGDVSVGAVIKSSADFNLARETVLNSKLSPNTPGFDIQRACGTSLETIINIGNKISVGQIDVGIAAGVDTNSDVPLRFRENAKKKFLKLNMARSIGKKFGTLLSFRPSDFFPNIPSVKEPRTGFSMGEHCEQMAQEWGITRKEQDLLAFESHQAAERAYQSGFFEGLVVDFKGQNKDGIVRGQTTIEKLSSLKPAFERSEKGTLTAGNSTPLTDGASTTLLCSEDYASKNGWQPRAFLVDAEAAAVDFVNGEGLLMAPTVAVARLLKRNNLKLQDFDYYEIHEAFAAQVLCTLKAWESAEYCKERLGWSEPLGSIDRAKMNVKGGSLALGHPFGATGSRVVNGALRILDEEKSGRVLVSICTAGGMGVAAIIEK